MFDVVGEVATARSRPVTRQDGEEVIMITYELSAWYEPW